MNGDAENVGKGKHMKEKCSTKSQRWKMQERKM